VDNQFKGVAFWEFGVFWAWMLALFCLGNAVITLVEQRTFLWR
jgi:succinate-acetate transporter protein